MLALVKYLEVVKTSLASFETNDVAIGDHLGVIHKKHQNTHEPRNRMHWNCSLWPKEASYSPGSAVMLCLAPPPQMLLLWPIRALGVDRHHCVGNACCSLVWLGSGVHMKQFTCSSQSRFSIERNDNEKGVCGGGWIFSSGFSSMETTVASSIKQLFQRKDGLSLSLVPWYPRGLPGSWGLWGWQRGDVLCTYCICCCLDEWHGLVWLVHSPFVNSLCSFSFVLRD